MNIAIPALPCGNFSSVKKIIEKVGGSATIVEDPSRIAAFDKLIIAGVGAFDHGMSSIRTGGWLEALEDFALRQRRPVLGICLGMQLLCQRSEEGSLPGLGWIDADVVRFRFDPGSKLKIPHMGWNTVRVAKENPLIPPDIGEQRYYFVHSYHAVCRDADDVLATTSHGFEVTAALSRANIMGVQFHPEKSHRFGMALMRRFVEMPC
jgi:glutamine amidotransferase